MMTLTDRRVTSALQSCRGLSRLGRPHAEPHGGSSFGPVQESPRQPAIKQNLCHSKVQLCHSGLQQKDTCRLQRRGSPGSGPGPPRPCGWSGAEGGIRERSGRLYECYGRQLTLSREGWPWSTPAWRMRRTGGAGRRGPSPRFLCPHRHLVTPGTVRTSPCPPAWLAGPSILHRLGTSVRIPREWFPQQQTTSRKVSELSPPTRSAAESVGRRTSASY